MENGQQSTGRVTAVGAKKPEFDAPHFGEQDLDAPDFEEPDLDVAGLIRRARRIADLSQRDLSRLLGVDRATVARWETRERMPHLRQFEAVLRVAGLRLQVVLADAPAGVPADTHADVPVDAHDAVLPMREDGVRDSAGRRYPAHLDPAPWYQVWRPRWDRPELHLHCPRRHRRDTRTRPTDHLTLDDVHTTLADWRTERLAKIRRLMARRLPTADTSDVDTSDVDTSDVDTSDVDTSYRDDTATSDTETSDIEATP